MTDEKKDGDQKDYSALLQDPAVGGQQYLNMMLRDPSWSRDYMARTHAGRTDPEGKAAHERHLKAVALAQSVYERKAATAGIPSQAQQLAGAKEQEMNQIRQRMLELGDAYTDKRHKGHTAALDEITGRFQKLNQS